jgi:ubiquinone/menaquinone biosynthesis C-methylase UbiE
MEPTSTYALGSSQPELERLRLQSDALGEQARSLFDRIDIRPGWKVLDVGCGPRGVLDLLAARVGRGGSVTGLDASPVMVAQARSFVTAMGHENVNIVQGDAGASALPHGTFDLVHARLLLVNLPPTQIAKVVAEMVALARPRGIVAIQDIDAGTFGCDPPHPAWDKLFSVFSRIVCEGKTGRQLPRLLREAGATEVASDAHAMFCPPGHLWRPLMLQLSDVTRPRALQLGLASAEELDTARAALQAHLDDPTTSVLAPVLTQAWGRRAATS